MVIQTKRLLLLISAKCFQTRYYNLRVQESASEGVERRWQEFRETFRRMNDAFASKFAEAAFLGAGGGGASAGRRSASSFKRPTRKQVRAFHAFCALVVTRGLHVPSDAETMHIRPLHAHVLCLDYFCVGV